MKKIFSLFAAVLMAGSMMAADPIVLTFSDWGNTTLNKDSKPSNTVGDFNTAYTTTTLIDSLQGAAGFVTCSATSKCYAGRVGYGNKLGSSSAIGSFTLDLVTPAVFDSIVVNCSSYSATEGSLSINGGTAIDLTDGGASNKVLRNVKYVPTGVVSSFSVATTAKRAYVKSITFYPAEVAPVANDTVFFVNAADWAAVKVYAWGGTAAGTEWPGLDATKADYQLQGKDVYYFVAAQGAYANCLFNNNAGTQTADLVWAQGAGKYYYNGSWMTRAELEAPVVVDIYIKHNWAENSWTWKQMTYDAKTETYLLREIYGASGCNWNTKADDAGASWIQSPTVVGYPANGDSAVFAFKNGEITITKIGEPSPEPTTRWMKHNWAGLNNWTWKEMTREGETDTYTLRDIYGASGCNWNTIGDDAGATWVGTPTLVGNPANGDSAVFTLVNGEITITKIVVEEPVDDCDWANIEFLGDGAQGGALNNKYKMCAPTAQNIVNIQRPGFAAGAGIYCAFPTGITACSLPEGKYAIQGAGICVYISAFTAEYTDFTVTCGETVHNVTVYYADGQDAPAPTYTVTYTVTGFDAEHCGLRAGYVDETETIYGLFEAGENTVPENVSAFVSTAVSDNYTVEVKVNDTAVTLTDGVWYSDAVITADMTIDVTFTAPQGGDEENPYASIYTSNVTFTDGTNSSLNDKINIGENQYDAFKIGTSKDTGNCTITLPAGTEHLYIHATGWSLSETTTMTVSGAGLNATETLAYYLKISGTSPYTVDAARDASKAFFAYDFATPLAEAATVTLSGNARVVFFGVNAVGANTPTAVENVEAVKAVKKIENGQVIIIRDGVRYNAVGAKL